MCYARLLGGRNFVACHISTFFLKDVITHTRTSGAVFSLKQTLINSFFKRLIC